MKFLEKRKEDKYIKQVNEILKKLENADYTALGHSILRIKWLAVKNDDNSLYNFAECLDEALTIFKRKYKGGLSNGSDIFRQ